MCSSCCLLSRYFAYLTHDKVPFWPHLYLKNTSKLVRYAPGFCWFPWLCRAWTVSLKREQEQSKATPQAGDAVGDARCLTGCSASSGSGGVPARNTFRNFEMLISQRSLASEPFPWGSYSGAIYS